MYALFISLTEGSRGFGSHAWIAATPHLVALQLVRLPLFNGLHTKMWLWRRPILNCSTQYFNTLLQKCQMYVAINCNYYKTISNVNQYCLSQCFPKYGLRGKTGPPAALFTFLTADKFLAILCNITLFVFWLAPRIALYIWHLIHNRM